MSELSEMCMEHLRVRARRAKAMAMEKHKAGDLAGAKEYAVKAKKLNPFLNGLVRLNAVLDVLHGFEKKIDGEVDWYAVLAVDPTADVVTIQRRNKNLLLSIVMDDSDDSVGSIDEAKKILADCWRSFCDENSKKLYDKRRQERADYVRQQQLKRASQGPSFTSNPVTLSAPNPPQRVSKENERMVQPPVRVSCQVPMSVPMSTVTPVTLSAPNPPESISKENERMVHPPVRVSGKVPMSTVTPVTLSAPNPPESVRKENERMVQPPVRVSGKVPFFTSNPVILSAFNPPQRVSKENERMVQPPVRVSGKAPLFTITPVILSPSPSQRPKMSNRELKGIFEVKVGQHFQLPSRISVDDLRRATQVPSLLAPKPVVNSPRLKTFDEEKEELVEVNVEQFVQPPLPISRPPKRGIGGGSKRKAPTHMLHANKLRRINEDAGIRSIERRGDNVVPSLESLVSACKQANVASSSAAIPPQESKKCNAPNSVNTESTNKMVTVQWRKGVYPKEGDVWAMYENWSPSWGFPTPKEVVNKYEMVEVLEDFDDIRGVTVAPLVKVPGFKAVFRRLPIPKTFPKKELARFSHQVASHFLTGQEGNNAPKGCLELDPAAMPPELLKVFPEEALKSLKNQEEVFETMNKKATVPVYKIKQEKMV